MQAISSDSQNILTLALIGIVLSGTWLAYNLGLFTFFSGIKDEKKKSYLPFYSSSLHFCFHLFLATL